jgi:hypothetical protein
MTTEQRLNAANEINGLWVRHIRNGEAPPDVDKVSRILERYELGECGAARRRNLRGTLLKLVDPSGA